MLRALGSVLGAPLRQGIPCALVASLCGVLLFVFFSPGFANPID